jgi:hypothetical protein
LLVIVSSLARVEVNGEVAKIVGSGEIGLKRL